MKTDSTDGTAAYPTMVIADSVTAKVGVVGKTTSNGTTNYHAQKKA